MMLSHIAHIAKKRQELEEAERVKEVIGSPNGLCTYMPPIPIQPTTKTHR